MGQFHDDCLELIGTTNKEPIAMEGHTSDRRNSSYFRYTLRFLGPSRCGAKVGLVHRGQQQLPSFITRQPQQLSKADRHFVVGELLIVQPTPDAAAMDPQMTSQRTCRPTPLLKVALE